MNRYVAFTFGTVEQAAQARRVVRDLENHNQLSLYDAVVLAKDAEGGVSRHGDHSGAPVIGALVGALMGLLLVFAFTIFGILAGAALGALLAALLFIQHIEGDDIARVEKQLRPGTSALLLLVSSGDVAALGSSLRGFDPRVHESTLPLPLHATLRLSLR